jgi:hypothetical protein
VDGIDLTTTLSYPGIGDVTFTNQIEIAAQAPAVTVEVHSCELVHGTTHNGGADNGRT